MRFNDLFSKLFEASSNKEVSAGLFLWNGETVFIVRPGGPFYSNRPDVGIWSLPKGNVEAGEDLLEAAIREFKEETGSNLNIDKTEAIDLGEVKLKSGKIIHAYACEGGGDEEFVSSNTFKLEWPAKSGIMQDFPEIETGKYVDFETAKKFLHPVQAEFISRFQTLGNK